MNIEDVLRTIEENIQGVNAETEQGLDKYKTWNFEEALEILKARSELNDVAAQFALANMYFNGQGIIAYDKKRARYWFQRAADQGFLPAAREFGYTVLADQTMDESLVDQAFIYLEKAADSDDLKAKEMYVEETLKYLRLKHRVDKALQYIEQLKRSPKDSYDLKRYEEQAERLVKVKEIFVTKSVHKALASVFTVIGSVILAVASTYTFLGLNPGIDTPVLNKIPLLKGDVIFIFDRNVVLGMILFAAAGLFVTAGNGFDRQPWTKLLLVAATTVTLGFTVFQTAIIEFSDKSLLHDCFIYIGMAIIAFYVVGGILGYSVKKMLGMKG